MFMIFVAISRFPSNAFEISNDQDNSEQVAGLVTVVQRVSGLATANAESSHAYQSIMTFNISTNFKYCLFRNFEEIRPWKSNFLILRMESCLGTNFGADSATC